MRIDIRHRPADFGNGTADTSFGVSRCVRRVGSKPGGGHGRCTCGVDSGLLAKGNVRPILAPQGFWPTRNDIDGPLIAGAALFGIGWGLVGLCPGPALESVATLSPGVLVFVAAMAAGMGLHDWWQKARPRFRSKAHADG
jgi:uncharacterized membrane protein YedE/YeeE